MTYRTTDAEYASGNNHPKGEMKPSREFTVESPDVKAVREKAGLSLSEFAQMNGVKVKTLRNWE